MPLRYEELSQLGVWTDGEPMLGFMQTLRTPDGDAFSLERTWYRDRAALCRRWWQATLTKATELGLRIEPVEVRGQAGFRFCRRDEPLQPTRAEPVGWSDDEPLMTAADYAEMAGMSVVQWLGTQDRD